MAPADHPHAGQPVRRSGPSVKDAQLVAIRPASRPRRIRRGHPGARGAVQRQGRRLPCATGRGRDLVSVSFPLPWPNEPWLGSALPSPPCGRPRAARRFTRTAGCNGHFTRCLPFAEFAARHAQRYAAIVAFTGGLIGPACRGEREDGSCGTLVRLGRLYRFYRTDVLAGPGIHRVSLC